MDFDKIIPDLRARLAAAQVRLAELRESRRPHALGAATGSARAEKAIAGIDAEVSTTTAEGETLAMALEEAQRLRAEAEAKAAEEERRRREAEARKIADEIGEAGCEVDRAARKLVACLDARADLIVRLSETGAAYPGLLKALRNPVRICGALLVAGLGRYRLLPHVVGPLQKPLAEADAIRDHVIRFPRDHGAQKEVG